MAQNASAGADAADDIVVTARRREESLSKVPAAISALTADQIRTRGIETEADLQAAVPGLVLRDGNTANQLNYVIRGQTVDAFTSSQPGVLPYINEVQITGNNATAFLDLENIQVLKGPQGTLFGRNATGGAVLYQTAAPTNRLEGSLTGRFGNQQQREVEAVLNLPLVDDKVLLRVAGILVRREGFIRNILRNETLGDRHDDSGRISLTLRPTERIENKTVFEYDRIRGTNIAGPAWSFNACGSSATGLNDAAACFYGAAGLPPAYTAANPRTAEGYPAFVAEQTARGPFVVEYNSPSYITGRSHFLTNTTRIELGDTLVLKNIAGLAYNRIHYAFDGDRSPFDIYNFGNFGTLAQMDALTTGQFRINKQWSEELQLQGSVLAGYLKYILGGYYGYQSQEEEFSQNFFGFYPIAPGASSYSHDRTINRSKAIFGQATFDLSRVVGLTGLSITGGLRNTWEGVRAEQLPRSTTFGFPGLARDTSRPSWTIGLDYQATPDLMVYAVQRGSFRTGGFNAVGSFQPGTVATGGSEFLPETTTDVELGAKFAGRIAGAPVRMNVAVYRQHVNNIQRSAFILVGGFIGTFTVNVPEAVIKGFEADANVKLAPWLTVGGVVAHTDARFTRNQVTQLGITIPYGPYPDTPRWSGSLFAQIDVALPQGNGDVRLRTDFYAQSPFYFSSTNNSVTPGTKLPAYELTKVRLDWSHIKGSGLGASLFVDNLFDKRYYTGGVAVGNVLGYNNANPGRPRTYGAEIRYTF